MAHGLIRMIVSFPCFYFPNCVRINLILLQRLYEEIWHGYVATWDKLMFHTKLKFEDRFTMESS